MNEQAILPDDGLTDDDRTLAQRIRTFARDKIAPFAREIDEKILFRRETVNELGAADILRGPLPEALGGGGWSALQVAIANEEMGAVCGSTRGFMAVQSGLVADCVAGGTDEQRAQWLEPLLAGNAIGCFALTEPEAGSDVASLRCHARPDGEGWQLHGEKIWITNGGVADVAVVFANVDPDAGRKGIAGFVVPTDRAGLRRDPMPGVELGHRGSDHAHLRFDGLKVTRADVLGGPDGLGTGFQRAMDGLNAGRLSVAAGAVGILRAALIASTDFTSTRQQFGKPVASFQMVQERLADMLVDLMAARELVFRCARRRDQGIETPADLAAAKLFATEAASRACDQAVLLHGGRGYSSAAPVERLLRDAMGLRIYEGTSLIQKLILSRALR